MVAYRELDQLSFEVLERCIIFKNLWIIHLRHLTRRIKVGERGIIGHLNFEGWNGFGGLINDKDLKYI